MMVFLPLDTWIRLVVWMMIGFDLYLFYGMKNSVLNKGALGPNSYRIVSLTGMVMVLILVVVAFLHHGSATDDTGLFYFSLGFAALHLLIYGAKMSKKPVG